MAMEIAQIHGDDHPTARESKCNGQVEVRSRLEMVRLRALKLRQSGRRAQLASSGESILGCTT